MSAAEDILGAVHTKVRHDSARGHVTGSARYIDDMPMLPGTLEVVLVTSPHAHARIVSIDVSAARAADGVHGIVTAADIPGHNDIGPIFDGEPVLAHEVVDYVGAPVVAIGAETFDQGMAAAALIKIEYEELPAILEIEDALEAEILYLSAPDHDSGENPKAQSRTAAHQGHRRTALRRAGPLLSGEQYRAGSPARRRRPGCLQLDPAPQRSSAWGGAYAGRADQCGDG